jgi:flagellar FliL protein
MADEPVPEEKEEEKLDELVEKPQSKLVPIIVGVNVLLTVGLTVKVLLGSGAPVAAVLPPKTVCVELPEVLSDQLAGLVVHVNEQARAAGKDRVTRDLIAIAAMNQIIESSPAKVLKLVEEAAKEFTPPPPAAKPEEESRGQVFEVPEPFIVNLNEPEGSRFLKMVLAVELQDKATIADFTVDERRIRDDILRYLSGLTVAQTLGETGKEAIALELVTRIDKRLGDKQRVKRVFFTQFVVQ